MKNNLEEIRKNNNEKQEDLAKILGVSRQTIISIEKGKYNPSIILAFKIHIFAIIFISTFIFTIKEIVSWFTITIIK